MIKKYLLLFFRGWKSFYENINSFVSIILLTVVYIFGVGISFIIVKIFKIRLAEVKNSNTYWNNIKKTNKNNYFKQF